MRPGSLLTFAGSLALVALVTAADSLTGYEIRLAILNLAPVALATWRGGRDMGLAVGVAAVVGWLLVFHSSHPYSHIAYYYWEAALLGATCIIFVLLLARLREALECSDRRFVTVLEGLDAAVFVEDARGEVLYANRRHRDAFGSGRPQLGEGGETYDPETRRWYLVQSRALQWVDARPVSLHMLSDVTEQKRVRELMQRHRDGMHDSARLIALGEFASAIAHELSQPLAAIGTYNNASLLALESQAPDVAALRGAMEKCRDQARRAGAIIQRLRELLRHPEPALAEHDLNELAQSARDLAAAEAMQADVKVELALAGQPLPVLADRVLLQQVVLNLLRNAIEAAQQAGSRTVAVRIAPGAHGGSMVQVSDRGGGVAPQIAGRLFQAFVSAKPGGLGLGLSICRSVVEAHGGTIGYRPNGERGSVFEFHLPARAQ